MTQTWAWQAPKPTHPYNQQYLLLWAERLEDLPLFPYVLGLLAVCPPVLQLLLLRPAGRRVLWELPMLAFSLPTPPPWGTWPSPTPSPVHAGLLQGAPSVQLLVIGSEDLQGQGEWGPAREPRGAPTLKP